MVRRSSLAILGLVLSLGATATTMADEGKPSLAKSVDYAKDVAPILQAKCQNCHRPGQSAPFSLLTYEQAKKWSAAIGEVVEEGRMPPWHAAPGHLAFENDRSLSAEQKSTLLAWVDADCPSGDLSKAPAPREFSSEWKIPKPDVILTMDKEIQIKADGTMPYQWVKIPTGFEEDKWIQAAEVRPSDRRVVHHVLVFVVPKDTARPRDGLNARAQLCGYAPGDVPAIFPAGTAKKITAGSELWLQIHYTPIGKPTKDRTSIGLAFAKEPVKAEVGTHGIFQTQFLIPAGADNHPVGKSMTVPTDVKLLNLWPHMHVRGKDFRFTVTYPDGTKEILLDVPKYDFSWQTTYNLKEPKRLPKGTKIDCVAHFDNSANNKSNPDPKKAVHWGEQTYDEMMIGYIDYVIDGPNALKIESLRRREPQAQAGNNNNGGGLLRALMNRRAARQNQAQEKTKDQPKEDKPKDPS